MLDYCHTSQIPIVWSGSSYSSGTPGTINLPSATVNCVKPLIYNFRVAEYVDKAGNIRDVKLQTEVYEVDPYGANTIRRGWTDVERIKLDYVEPTV